MAVDLLPSQRNDLAVQLQRSGLDHADFEWRLQESQYSRTSCDTLVHVPTDYFFLFDWGENQHVNEFSPSTDRSWARRYSGSSWASVQALFDQWLASVEHEYAQPDLWAELSRDRALLEPAGDVDESENTPFTPEERALISQQLREIKEAVAQNYGLQGEQLAALEAQLNYLEQAAGRVGRTDWRSLVVGTLLGAVVNAVLTPEVVRATLVMIAQGLSHLFGGHGFPQLPGGGALPGPQ